MIKHDKALRINLSYQHLAEEHINTVQLKK